MYLCTFPLLLLATWFLLHWPHVPLGFHETLTSLLDITNQDNCTLDHNSGLGMWSILGWWDQRRIFFFSGISAGFFSPGKEFTIFLLSGVVYNVTYHIRSQPSYIQWRWYHERQRRVTRRNMSLTTSLIPWIKPTLKPELLLDFPVK